MTKGINRLWAVVLLAGILLPLPVAAQEGDTPPDLMAVYQMAVESDPRIQQARARLDQAREAAPQARSRWFPQVSLSGQMSESTQDGEQIGVDPNTGDIGLIPFESESETTSYGIEVRQTLFRWDAWVGLSEAEARVAQAEATYESALQDLLIRTANAYFDLLVAEESLETRRMAREAFEAERDRAEFAREVGTASLTDVEEARAAHDRALADEIAAERQLEVAREALFALTGRYIPEVQGPDEAVTLRPPEPADIDFWVNRALENNPELNAARHLADAANEQVRRARSGHYPTLDLVASRNYVDRTGDNVFQTQDTTNDSVQLQLSVPLFAGGQTRSQVREAKAAEREAWAGVRLTTRQVRQMARDAFLGVRSGVARVEALRQSVRSSETAVEATEVGVDVGSRSTIDLLNARRALADARAQLSEVRYAYLVDTLRLQRATGQLDSTDLERLSGLFSGGGAGD